MTARAFTTLTLATVLAVFLTLAGYYWPSLWLVYLFKPLATLFLILIAFFHWIENRSAYSQWIVIGLVFSFLGDVFLIWPNQYFLPGLAAFLLTHVAYLVAFTRECRFLVNFVLWLAYLLVIVAFCSFLYPTVPTGLKVPVLLYAILLATMAGQAMGNFLELRTASALRAAVGALLFLLSDLLLAFDRFHRPLLYATALILIPYYVGQYLIASSTANVRSPMRPR